MNLDLKLRATKLIDELEGWFLSESIKPPVYVQRQIDQLREAIKEADK